MRNALAWMIEQACRIVDDRVCEIANLTHEPEA